MKSSASQILVRRLRLVPTACGLLAMVVSAMVLAGWVFHVPLLKSILPGTVSMKPNTALAFVVAGAALVLLSGTSPSPLRARAGQWLALLVALIGVFTLGEFLLDWPMGIDEVLFKDDPNAVATLIPGRMAPSTAVCFVLLGLALMWTEWEPRRGFRPAELLALVAGVVGLSSLVEYAIGQPILYSFSQYTRMALPTAVVFLALSTGVLLARPAQGVVGALRSGRVGPWERAVYAAMGLALLGVLAGGAWFYRAQEQQARREVEAELEAIARLKADQIIQWRAERLGDAAVLMDSQFFAEGMKRWLEEPRADLAEKILGRFRTMQQHNRYSDVLLLDTRGQVRLRLSGRADAPTAQELEALATAFRTRQPVLSDLHADPVDLPPHADLIAPIFQKAGVTLQPIGAINLEIEARQFLFPLIQSWPTASRSAETLLVRREGESVLFLNELRHRPDSAFRLRIPLTRQEVPAVMAVLGTTGVFRGTDYRGVKVFSALKQIPDTSWAMVTKVDEAEALAEWRFRAGLIVAVIVALALALAGAAAMVWQQWARYRDLSQSAEALREAELRFRTLFEQSPVGVLTVDLQSGLPVEFNDLAARQLGYSREEFARLRIGDYEAHETPEQTRAHIEWILREGADQFETRHRTKTGEIREVLVTARAMKLNGRVLANCVFQDVTERKRAEAALALQARIGNISLTASDDEMFNEVLKVILEFMHSPFGVFGYLDEDGALVAPTMTQQIWDQCRIPGKPVRFPRETWGDSSWPRAIREKEANYSNEVSTKTPGGHVTITRHISLPILFQGEVIGLFQVANKETDYTEADVRTLETIAGHVAYLLSARLLRERAQEALRRLNADLERRVQERTTALRESRERFALAVRGSNDGIWDWNVLTNEEFFSDRWCEMLGYTQGELQGEPATWMERLHPDDRGLVGERLRRHLEHREPYDVEFRMRTKGGEYRWFRARGQALWNEQGRAFRMAGSMSDITERRAAEARIEQLNTELQRRAALLEVANKELESFSYSVSHDLRAPLRHVQSYVDMLTRETGGQLADKPARYLKTIAAASQDMGRLLDDLLAFSRMGRAEMRGTRVDLDGLVRECLRNLELATRDRHIIWKIPPLPQVTGDPSMLRQVFANLLENAVKYTRARDPAEIEIGVMESAQDSTAPSQHSTAPALHRPIVLFVRDNGAGFDMRYAHKLFGIFQRLHSSEEFEGTGIGLANVQRIVHRHGGRVWAEGEIGRGATFYFSLPRQEEAVPSRG